MADFSSDELNQLQELWVKGHSTAEIARQMGRSKNSIVGKAHRLGLESRPSPIIRSGEPKARNPRPRRAGAITLPPVTVLTIQETIVVKAASHPETRRTIGGREREFKIQDGSRPAIKGPTLATTADAYRNQADATQPARPVASAVRTCQFPIGDPKDKVNFHFCGKPAWNFGAYCVICHSKCYAPISARREI